MASLQDLPQELLAQTCMHLSSLRDVARFSSTCRPLFKAWAGNKNQIGQALLPRSFLAGQNAYDLAVLELTEPTTRPGEQDGNLQVQRIFARMVENETMGKRVIALRREGIESHIAWSEEHGPGFADDASEAEIRELNSKEGMEERMNFYYVARQLARTHALDHDQQQQVMENIESHKGRLGAHRSMLSWMMYSMKDKELRLWHGMSAEGDEWVFHIDPREPVNVRQPPCWAYAEKTLKRCLDGPRKVYHDWCDGEGECRCGPPTEEYPESDEDGVASDEDWLGSDEDWLSSNED